MIPNFRLLLCGLIAATVVAGCGDATITVQPKGFTRSDAVAFLCIEDATGMAVDRQMCNEGTEHNLLALVTQQDRGEIASVDLRRETLIDTNRVIPGHTFAAVGDLPSAIAVAESSPQRAYVANVGSLDVVAVPISRLVNTDNETSLPMERIAFDVAPTALAIDPAGTRLFVSLTDASTVAVIELGADGSFGAQSTIALQAPTVSVLTLEPEETTWCHACPKERCAVFDSSREGGLSWAPSSRGNEPEPTEAVVDEQSNSVLVADASLPFIYRINLTSLAVESLPTVAPVHSIALTQPLPIEIGATETKRYLYAVNSLNGRITAMDYPSGTPFLVGSEAEGDPVHLDLSAPVVDLAYVERSEGDACSLADDDATPLRLNGAFLSAVTLNGRVHVFDLYDEDASSGCRDGCRADGDGIEIASYIRRHRPRLAARIRRNLSLATTPTFTVGPLSIRVDDDGVSSGGVAPDLATFDCPADMTQVFPDQDDDPALLGARVCTLSDPWTARVGRWLARYEGAIPGTRGGDPKFTIGGSGFSLDANIDFCAAGVLGRTNAAAAEPSSPEAEYAGDALYIREALRSAQQFDDSCQALFGEDAGDEFRFFPILGSARNRLQVGAGSTSLDEVQRCLGMHPAFEVRVQNAFYVSTGGQLPLHRVITGAADVCVVDPLQSPRLQYRAIPGTTFDNASVAFRLEPSSEEGAVGLLRDTAVELSFVVDNAPIPMQFTNTALLPTQIAHVPERDRIYVIDALSRNFRYVRLDTLSRGEAFP